MEFHFVDFIAKACSTKIKPNSEILEFGWFTISKALKLNLLDTTRKFIEQYKQIKSL